MSKSKKSVWMLLVVLILTLTLTLTACGAQSSSNPTSSGSKASEKVYEFKMGTTMPKDSITSQGAFKLAELVSEKTNGQVKISVYPDMQLGDPKTQAEGLKMGTIDSAWVSSAALSPFIPEMGVISFPYLFKDRAHVAKA